MLWFPEIIPLLFGLAFVFAPLALAIWALVRSFRLDREIRRLRQALLTMAQTPAVSAAPVEEPAPEPETPTQTEETQSAETAAPMEMRQPEPDRDVAVSETAGPAPADLPSPPPRPGERLEERLASRWLIWLGAIALALAALFLVKYAAEFGLLGPGARVSLGIALGLALTLVGERLRRTPLQRRVAAIKPNHLPGAFVSAGVFALYASIYAAYGLYAIIAPLTAFTGLGIVSLGAFALATIHMPIVAIIGLLAGFLTPALIESTAPNTWGLFGYLAVIVAVSYGVLHYRAWRWLAYLTLAGALGWELLWIVTAYHAGDILALGAFLAFLVALVVWSALRLVPADEPRLSDFFLRAKPVIVPEQAVWMAIAGAIALFGLMVSQETVTTAVLLIVLAGALGLTFIAYRFSRYDEVFIAAGLHLCVSLTAWLPWQALRDARSLANGETGSETAALLSQPLVPSAVQVYFGWNLAFGLVMLVVGFAVLRTVARPALWASVSVLTATFVIVLIHSRLGEIVDDRAWIMLCLATALLAVIAATLLNSSRNDRHLRLSLGVYAVAAAAGIGFALAFALENAWLTVALSLMLPALAWIAEKLDLKEFRLVALVVAGIVLARLALNPYVLDYAGTGRFGAQWVIYGYGVPAAAFYGASLIFARTATDRLVTVLQSGALVFALLLISFEIRIFVEGSIRVPRLTAFELALHSGVWLIAGWWRGRAWHVTQSGFDRWWSMILIGLGATAVLGQLTALNPMLTGDAVGRHIIANKLIVIFLLPAVLLGLVAPIAERLYVWRHGRLGAGTLALATLMMWLTAETKHAFQGSVMVPWIRTEAENYAYSAVWLVAALAVLVAGLLSRKQVLRYGALVILLVVVIKVFVLDMWGLGGLYRVASFLGLGLSLLGIGYLYQRFIQRQNANSGG